TLNPPSRRWTTSLPIPINIKSYLIPTFCSSVVARLYTIILRVRISGARCDSFDLEVPLQVINTCKDKNQTSRSPIRENQHFLEFRRSSDSPWLSGNSAVNSPALQMQ